MRLPSEELMKNWVASIEKQRIKDDSRPRMGSAPTVGLARDTGIAWMIDQIATPLPNPYANDFDDSEDMEEPSRYDEPPIERKGMGPSKAEVLQNINILESKQNSGKDSLPLPDPLRVPRGSNLSNEATEWPLSSHVIHIPQRLGAEYKVSDKPTSLPVTENSQSFAYRPRTTPNIIQLRVDCGNENYLILVSGFLVTYNELVTRIDTKILRFSNRTIAQGMRVLRYKDQDGDLVRILCDEDLRIAFDERLEMHIASYHDRAGMEMKLLCKDIQDSTGR